MQTQDTEHQGLPTATESQEEAKRESQVWPVSTPISGFYSSQTESRNVCSLQAHRCLSQQLHKTNPHNVQETPPHTHTTLSLPHFFLP